MRFGFLACGVMIFVQSVGALSNEAQKAAPAAPALTVSQNLVVPLESGWQFRQVTAGAAEGNGWLPATVPGDVHLDLLANKKIPDPFYRDNEAKLQWIEKESWEYQLTFEVSAATMARSNVDLVFDGLDGPSTVWLNGVEVLKGINSFRTGRVPAKAHLHVGKNTLRVLFASPIKAAEELGAQDPWIAKTKTDPKTFLRKPAYEYGWDWGPRFVTCGIWRPVRLEAWDKVRIEDFAVRQRDVSKEVAHLDAAVEVVASKAGSAKVALSYVDAGQPATLTRVVTVHAGSNQIEIPVEIRQPKLWYPAGYGEQPLYSFTAQVSGAGAGAAEKTVKVGLRSVVLRRDLDKWGRSFELDVNGIPIFAKGADVIPFDSFPNRVTTADYRRVLESAKQANMNMIRHWGGGYYETDEFYSICDELGLMIWQDFQFGNDWQPGTYAFKQNIEAEAEGQVKRLRNHPSIVLWSGNNETEVALNWGPRATAPADVKFQMWQDYLTEFSGILNRVVEKLDAETPYWPSSPSADYEPVTASFHTGDDHIWDVWHGRVPFTTYETHRTRFVTEYGFQSFPEMKTVEAFTEPADRASIFTPVMLAHQKNNEGNSIIHDYMMKDYGEPKDFSSFLYASQVLQAEGIKIGAEHFRRSRPETMGSIYWQLNDCWPVASWASIDYYGRWKALQYYAKRFYAPLLVSAHIEGDAVKAYIVSDLPQKPGSVMSLRMRLMDMDGKVLLEERKAVEIAPLSSKVYMEWPLKKIADAGGTDASRVYVVAELSGADTRISRNMVNLGTVQSVRLKPAALKLEAVPGLQLRGETHPVWLADAGKFETAKNCWKVKVSSPVLARSVYLTFGNLDVELSDNYFDVLPGETEEIGIWTNASLDAVKAQMKAISLVDAFNGGAGPHSASLVAAH
jgi:beta-mannosidase